MFSANLLFFISHFSGICLDGATRKYSTSNPVAVRLLLSLTTSSLVMSFTAAAYSTSTWRKHESAMNSFTEFQNIYGASAWPIPTPVIVNYITWMFSERNVKSATVASYLSSLKFIHTMKGLSPVNFDSVPIKVLLRGKENIEMYRPYFPPTRKVMTLPLLKILGHEIACTNWAHDSKLVVWAAALVGFFGSFRMGEILPNPPFNADDTLLWSDVKFVSNDHILFHVKHPKSRSSQGDFIDIFTVTGLGVCPVTTLRKLHLSISAHPDTPVFQFANGTPLTCKKFNETLSLLLTPHIGIHAKQITCHSFRAGIPSALARFPSIANLTDIKGWARWNGNDHFRYTRLKVDERRYTFSKIMHIFGSKH